MNKSRLIAFVFSFLLCTGAMAQSTNKEINTIKRNDAYLYAEATMASEKEAHEVATELLLKEVQNYIDSMPNLSKADNLLVKDILAKSESLMMMRGEMHRVFVYVKKQDISGAANATIINHSVGATITIGDRPEETGGQPEVTDVSKPQATLQQEEPAVNQPMAEQQPNNQAVKQQNEEHRLSQIPAWQQHVVDELLQCDDMDAVLSRLGRQRAEHRVKRFGSAADCQSRSKAFWIILDTEGKVVTVLGPGVDERVDFRTKGTEKLETYTGYNAIWFNL